MTRARNLSGLSTVTGQPTTTTPVNLGPLGVGTFARIYGTWEHDQINAVSVAATSLQVSGITTGLNVSGIITAQNGLNVTGNIVNGLNVSAGIATFAGNVDVNANVDISGNLTVAGTVTNEDLTDIDSIGVGTFRKGIIVAGVGTFSSGVGIADSIFHTGDDNTAIRFPAADTFTVETAGSEALRVDSSGRVLIGTTTEGAANGDELTVASNPLGNTGITLRSGTTSKGNIYFSDATSGTGEYDGWIQYDQNIRCLRLATATAEALRITSGQDVIIGNHTAEIEPGGYESHLEILGTATDAGISILRYSTNTEGPSIVLGKSKNASIGSNSTVAENDNLGAVEFYGTDTGWEPAAAVRAYADGEWLSGGDNTDSPGRLSFWTTPNASDDLSERMRITSDGKVLIGADSSRQTRLGSNSFEGLVQVESDGEMGFTLSRFIGTSGPPRLVLQKARGTGASPTIVQDDDQVGQLLFSGWDGDTFTNAAKINVEIDGTPGDDDMPGRITFETTADGASSTTERMRLTSGGHLLVGNTSTAFTSSAIPCVFGSGSGSNGISIYAGTSSSSFIHFADGTSGADRYRGYVSYAHGTNSMQLGINDTEALTINNSQNAKFVGIVTATEFVPTTQPYGTKNIIVNGAMQVAQRGNSSTTSGYKTIDRMPSSIGNTGQGITQTRQDLSSSNSGPFAVGFRKYKRCQIDAAGNTNTNAYVEPLYYKVEAQDLAASGWDCESSSSYITISFWFRVSTNQTFYLNLRSEDGTKRMFTIPFTAAGNNTWTKIVQKVPGNTSPTVQIDNNNEAGMSMYFVAYYGTSYTDNGTSTLTWNTHSGTTQCPDMSAAWLTAGASTFDITGLQMEVGSEATPYQFLRYGPELALCQRYYAEIGGGNYGNYTINGGYTYNNGNNTASGINLAVPLRANPTIGNAAAALHMYSQGNASTCGGVSYQNYDVNTNWVAIGFDNDSDLGATNHAAAIANKNSQALTLEAEL